MGEQKSFTVDDAYALNSPDDSIRLYGEWADTYDSGFVASSGYVLFIRIAEHLLRQRALINGPVLDVGCGTGLVGVVLRNGGIEQVDGVDISPPMLAEAGNKTTPDGEPVYRNLIAADLTKPLDIADNEYAGLVSAGTFTHGHLGPEPLAELWRIAAPGACCAIGVRTTHYDSAGFAERLAADVADGRISEPELVEMDMYAPEADHGEHSEDKAFIVLCQVLR